MMIFNQNCYHKDSFNNYNYYSNNNYHYYKHSCTYISKSLSSTEL